MDLFEQAAAFALERHAGAVRKDGATPVILHAMEAAAIAATLTADREVLAAAALHDTVEDAGVPMEEIRRRFGDRVADLVRSETEDKRSGQPPAQTWRRRKEESLAVLRESRDPGVQILWLGDKLSNMRAFYRGCRAQGDAFWSRFHQSDPAAQAWYFRTVGHLLEDLRDTPAYEEYNLLVKAVFGEE